MCLVPVRCAPVHLGSAPHLPHYLALDESVLAGKVDEMVLCQEVFDQSDCWNQSAQG